MKIRFLKPYRFANNGYSFDEYEAGQEYEVSLSCGDSAILSGVAEEVVEPAEPVKAGVVVPNESAGGDGASSSGESGNDAPGSGVQQGSLFAGVTETK